MSGVPFSALRSNTPSSPVRTVQRLDPFWDGVWATGAGAQWLTYERMHLWDRAGLIRAAQQHRNLQVSAGTAEARVRQNWQSKLDLASCLYGWKTATVSQVAALTGNVDLALRRSRTVGDLFAMSVADVGDVAGRFGAGGNPVQARMVRPSTGSGYAKTLLPRMTYAERVSVTGGEGWTSSGRYDRHNVLTVEFVLRVAEFLPEVVSILGEPFAKVSDLLYAGVGREAPHLGVTRTGKTIPLTRTGDAVLVRHDGLRIVIETTASASRASVGQKALRWAEELSRRPFDETGVVVLFLTVDRHDPFDGDVDRRVTRDTAKMVHAAVDQFPGRGDVRTKDRMLVASWRDYFPGPHMVTGEFEQLTAQAADGSGWASRALLDPGSVPGPAGMSAPLDVVAAASGLRSVPFQLRSAAARRPQFDVLQLGLSGWSAPPPHRADDRWRDLPQRALPFAPSGARSVAVIPDRFQY